MLQHLNVVTIIVVTKLLQRYNQIVTTFRPFPLPEDAAVDGHQGHLWQQSLHEGEERKACCEQKKEDALH